MILFFFASLSAASFGQLPPTSQSLIQSSVETAKHDRTRIFEEIRRDQSKPTTDAIQRIQKNSQLIKMMDQFIENAPKIQVELAAHRKKITPLLPAIQKTFEKMVAFEASVLITEEQTEYERLGLLKFRHEPNGSILISLADAIEYLDLLQKRIGFCEKDPTQSVARRAVLRKGLEDPLTTPLGFTYSQIRFAIGSLTQDIGAKLSLDGFEYQLQFADPSQLHPGTHNCDFGLLLIATHTTQGQDSVRLSFPIQSSSTLKAPADPTDLFVFRSLNDSHPDGPIWDGYAFWDKNALADRPYVSPFGLDQLRNSLRSPLSRIRDTNRRPHYFAFGFEHGVFFNPNEPGAPVLTWGAESGQNETDLSVPTEIPEFHGRIVKAVAAGFNHSVALLEDGSVWTWGEGSQFLGRNSNAQSRNSPNKVTEGIGNQPVESIFAGGSETLVKTENGTFWRWGTIQFLPQERKVLSDFLRTRDLVELRIGKTHILILLGDGTVWTAPTVDDHVPTQVIFEKGARAKQIECYHETFFAILENRQLVSWNTSGTPNPVAGFENWQVRSVHAGNGHYLAILEEGSLWGWGTSESQAHGFSGPVSPGRTELIESRIPSGTEIISIVMGSNISFLILSNGEIWGIGENGEGELAIGQIGTQGVGNLLRTLLPVVR